MPAFILHNIGDVKITLWERLRLVFVKKEYLTNSHGLTLVYKRMGGKIYFVMEIHNNPLAGEQTNKEAS